MEIQTEKAGLKYGFFKEGVYGKKGFESASYMDLETAETIIIDCCREYKNIG